MTPSNSARVRIDYDPESRISLKILLERIASEAPVPIDLTIFTYMIDRGDNDAVSKNPPIAFCGNDEAMGEVLAGNVFFQLFEDRDRLVEDEHAPDNRPDAMWQTTLCRVGKIELVGVIYINTSGKIPEVPEWPEVRELLNRECPNLSRMLHQLYSFFMMRGNP